MHNYRINHRFIIITTLLSVFLLTVAFAENTPQPEPKQAIANQKDTDYAWKEQLEKKHAEFIEWLQANYPDKAKELLAIRTKKPDEFIQQLSEVIKIYEPIKKAECYSPELANALRKDLELQDLRDKLLKDINEANEQQRLELIKQLKEIVAARFDIIIHKKQLYYDHLRRRLEKIKQKIEEQAKELEQLKAEKDQSVEQRMKELTEGAESVDW